MSKLDEAFLKAYAKVRGNGTHGAEIRRGANGHGESVPDADDEIETEIWSDSGGQHVVRPDEGVMNVASFIARTASGRTRGTSLRPDGTVPMTEPAPPPETPDWFALPKGDVAGSNMVLDTRQALSGPHFQPISLDLAAFDSFAPSAVLSSAPFVADPRLGRPLGAHETDQASTKERIAFAEPELDFEYHTVGHAVNTVVMPKVTASAIASKQVAAPSVVPQNRPSTPETHPDDSYDGAGEGEFLRTDVAHSKVNSERAEPLGNVDSERAEPLGKVKIDFAAAWEVDRFEFEEIVWELCAETSPLWQAAEQLEVACREGLKVLAITSPARGQGRSTLAITMARMLAATGLNVALIDGDLDKPSLADKMRLEIRLGWGDAVRTGLSAEEVAVQSVEDGFTVLPLATPDSSKGLRPAGDTTSKMISQLRDAFDIVVIDTANINVIGGWIPGSDSPNADSRCQIDAALVIQDLRREDPEAMQACLRRLHKLGIANIGLVENFSGE